MFEIEDTQANHAFTEEEKNKIAVLIYEQILEPTIELSEKTERKSRRKFISEYDDSTKEKFNILLEQAAIPVKFEKINAYRLNSVFKQKVEIFMTDENDKEKLIELIIKELWFILL